MTTRKDRFRLDELLVMRGLVPDLTEARATIMAGEVVVNDQREDKPGTKFSADVVVRMKQKSRFVSRGGDKLASAIVAFRLEHEFANTVVMDVGASTGGFTDCCLSYGAAQVFAVDVGENQLAWRLRQDPRVQVHEKTHIRDFMLPPEVKLDWVVADISFNSLQRLLPALLTAVGERRQVRYLLLVKPQFELPADKIPPGGVVVSGEDRQLALAAVLEALQSSGFEGLQTYESAVMGRTGNQEIFVLGRR